MKWNLTSPRPAAARAAVPRREYSNETRFGTWVLAIVLLVGPLLLLWLYTNSMLAGLVNPDAMDFAQLGRNLSKGQGFVTYILRPLAITHNPNPLAQPDVTHGPLYPFLLALAFGLLGAKDSVVMGMSGLFYLLTVPALYLLGARLFHRTVGLIAALAFMVNGAILEYAASGTHVMFFTFLSTCLFLALFQAMSAMQSKEEAGKPAHRPLLISGTLLGLLYLTDPMLFWMLPAVAAALVALLSPGRRWSALGWLLLPAGILGLPWMLRNALLTGNPIFGLRGSELWMGTSIYPGLSGYRMSPGDFIPGLGVFKAILMKVFLSASAGIAVLPQMPAAWLLAFVLPALFPRFSNPAVVTLRRTVVLCLIALFCGSLIFSLNIALLIALIPALLVFAVAYLAHLVQQAQMKRASVALMASLLVVALVSPLAAGLVTTHRPATLAQEPVARSLQQQTGSQEVCFSDQPWIVAWYADRPSIWIPTNDGKITDLRQQFTGARWLFLTEQARTFSPEWRMTFNGLMQWNLMVEQARAKNTRMPPSLLIKRDQAPITVALDRFVAKAPTEVGVPTAVVAAAPAASSQTGLQAKREDRLSRE